MDISIIIPFYKTPITYLEQALHSLECQIEPQGIRKEIILVQDGDHRNLKNTLYKFEGLNIKHIIMSKNNGLSFSRNLGVENSRFENILFLDADDILHREALLKLKEFKKTNDKYSLVFSNSKKFIDSPINCLKTIDSSAYFDLFKNFGMSKVNPIFNSIFCGPCIMVSKKNFEKVNGFNENFPCGEITELFLKYFVTGLEINHIPKVLYYYRDNPDGLSKRKDIHIYRALAIKLAYKMAFGIHLEKIIYIGRVRPFMHAHYNLLEKEEINKLPYLNREDMTFCPSI